VSDDPGKRGFESFSIDLRTVSNITFMTQGECGRRRKELIREAARSIHLATYNFDDEELANLLVGRAQAGVHVRCVLSWAKKRWNNPRMADKLRAAGIDVHLAHSHAKCLVVDDGRVLLGSANASAAKWQGLEFNLEMHSPDFAKRIVGFLDELLARDSQGASEPCAATDVALPPASP
jgi:phosphatidylserine/phosphatidylglycerophosphate/cardiolipin synthase-like enzyme